LVQVSDGVVQLAVTDCVSFTRTADGGDLMIEVRSSAVVALRRLGWMAGYPSLPYRANPSMPVRRSLIMHPNEILDVYRVLRSSSEDSDSGARWILMCHSVPWRVVAPAPTKVDILTRGRRHLSI